MSGERRMWAAALWQAVTDLASSSEYARADREDVVRWIGSYPSRDFRDVCSMAGFDADAVHERLKNLKSPQEAQAFLGIEFGTGGRARRYVNRNQKR